ncbi:hypothetical protein FHP08_04425 [Zeimonas arvi]|uniref:Uncharacterized protein n=1 Tax=Zeimonas arvi TaxID=2498847 RepID=A0A5C8P5G7_9BURK|nr:hypothetical protein FHP08_04425 [Zeimonas arvi]
MDGYLQTTIGIVVSVILFLIGYRQTIGARRERVSSANRAVYKALLRRLVLEEYAPKIDDINRLIEGKAHEFKVSPGDLHPDEQVLNKVFAEIFDNDFIAPEKRSEIESRVGSAFDELTKGKQKIDEARLASPDHEKRKAVLVGILGLLASLMGALVSLFLTIGKELSTGTDISAFRSFLPIFAVFFASLVSVIAISFVKKIREAPEDAPTRVAAAAEGALLEHEVMETLGKQGISFQIEPKIGMLRPDFVIEVGGKRIAIETKSWRSPPPISMISRVARYLQELLRTGAVDSAAVITRGRMPNLERLLGAENIQFVPFKEFPEWLKSRRQST